MDGRKLEDLMSTSTSTATVVAEPTVWFTWRRIRRIVEFVLLFILSVNFLMWWGQAVDEHHPIRSLRKSISSIASTVYYAVEPYLAMPVDILLMIIWCLGIALPLVAAVVGFGGALWAIFSLNASRK